MQRATADPGGGVGGETAEDLRVLPPHAAVQAATIDAVRACDRMVLLLQRTHTRAMCGKETLPARTDSPTAMVHVLPYSALRVRVVMVGVTRGA